MMYEQRDIVMIPFPYTDMSGDKQRPALILSNERVNKGPDRLCCFITSVEQPDGILIEDAQVIEGSLPLKSWAKPEKLFTVHKDVVRKKLCSVSEEFHDEIKNAILACIS